MCLFVKCNALYLQDIHLAKFNISNIVIFFKEIPRILSLIRYYYDNFSLLWNQPKQRFAKDNQDRTMSPRNGCDHRLVCSVPQKHSHQKRDLHNPLRKIVRRSVDETVSGRLHTAEELVRCRNNSRRTMRDWGRFSASTQLSTISHSF